MPLQPKKGASLKKVLFFKDKVTELSDEDYNYLKGKSAFKFLIDEGTFKLVNEPEEKPSLSKKERKKADKAAKEAEKKQAELDKKERQGK